LVKEEERKNKKEKNINNNVFKKRKAPEK